MRPTRRKQAFVLASSDHGTMIVNRFDRRMTAPDRGFGVGFQLLERSAFDPQEVDLALKLLDLRHKHFGDGVSAIDCGANIGVHTIEWAKQMTGWGSVVAIEAQERVFYALAGNIALNNCFNARAIHAAVCVETGTMRIPSLDHMSTASFGSLELRKRESTENIGQKVDYTEDRLVEVRCVSIDSLALERVDLIKIDVEGMELEALAGAATSIARSHPILLVESVKTDKAALGEWLRKADYRVFDIQMNFLAVHQSDPSLASVRMPEVKA